MKKVKKAVIPAAGFGTRFLPITKSVPKEMLPIVDKPALQYIVEELVDSGIKDILIITGRNKRSVEDHFDSTPELDNLLKSTNKTEFLKISKSIEQLANIHYVRQHEPKGLADAVYCAKAFVGDDPFALLLGDDIVYNGNGTPCIKQLVDCYETYGKTTIAAMKVADEEVSKYGNIGYSKEEGKVKFIEDIVEKPDAAHRLSNNVVIGRYVLEGDIFSMIEKTPASPCGEIYLTDTLRAVMKTKGLLGYEFDGIRYDTGDKFGYLKANIEYALRDGKLNVELKQYLKELTKTL